MIWKEKLKSLSAFQIEKGNYLPLHFIYLIFSMLSSHFSSSLISSVSIPKSYSSFPYLISARKSFNCGCPSLLFLLKIDFPHNGIHARKTAPQTPPTTSALDKKTQTFIWTCHCPGLRKHEPSETREEMLQTIAEAAQSTYAQLFTTPIGGICY